MTRHTIAVGNVTVTSLSDGHLEMPVTDFFPSVPRADWEPYRDELTVEGNIALNVGSFLVRSRAKTILVDTGLGRSDRGFGGAVFGRLLDDLRAVSVGVEDIDLVFVTRPTFPNARYLLPRADWEVYTRRDGMSAFAYIREQVTPLEGLGVLDLVEGEHEVTGEVTALPTPGHTPGHTSLLLSSLGERAAILGDAAHHPAQAHETGWSPRADADRKTSEESRRSLMDRIERDGAVAVSGHFPSPGFGRLVRVEGRRYWQAL